MLQFALVVDFGYALGAAQAVRAKYPSIPEAYLMLTVPLIYSTAAFSVYTMCKSREAVLSNWFFGMPVGDSTSPHWSTLTYAAWYGARRRDAHAFFISQWRWSMSAKSESKAGLQP